ncbi:hypothetical protein OAE48_04195 [Flavobacteriales bacterium]|nr:hypothetical protein [Flavobacteriales bacterium]
MKFTELRQSIESDQVNSVQDYYKAYLSKDVRDSLESLEGRFVYHLYSDIISREIDKDLEGYLGGNYRNTDSYAKDCVQMALQCSHLYGMRVKSWTDSALKCFDGFILCLIQDVLNERIKSNVKVGVEREKYHHLIEKGGAYARIGLGFDTVYQQRNEFTHVEVVEEDGKRRQKPMSQKRMRKMKEIILENFKSALTELEQKI